MTHYRPLDQSPKIASDPPPPLSDLPRTLPEPPLRGIEGTQFPLPPLAAFPHTGTLATSRRNRSGRSAGDHSGEIFPRSGSGVPARYASRAESDRLGSSLKDIPDDEARLVHVNDPERTNETFDFAGNSIRTSKYSVLTFLPRNLFEQFHRVAYIYFLIIAVLNQIPVLAVFGRTASLLPLCFVLLVTAVKDSYEDWRRHRSDRAENNRSASVLVAGEFTQKRWKEIRVGELVKVHANESLPCDMVLLSTSDPTGVAYIQTINLDGESNLKTRYAKQETQSNSPEAAAGIKGLIRCERPNRNIYGFLANLEIDGRRSSLGTSNIVLRGCELKNTAWAVGVAVYAGRETKVMLNNSGAQSKRSRLEAHMNRETIFLSIILFAMCTLVSVLHGVWLGNHKDELNLMPFYRKTDFSESPPDDYNYYGIGAEVVFAFLMSVIVFQIMIPISLYISMELVRLGQAYFMIRDQDLYDEATNSRFQCRALNINEDLGQIKFVFSDKTGTLTENKMEFQYASIGGIDYRGRTDPLPGGGNSGITVDGKILKPKMEVQTDPKLVECLRSVSKSEEAKYAYNFFLALAACNTIVPLTVETSDPSVKLIDYQGESPDEQALVYAAASYGFVLVERTSGHIIVDILGTRQRLNVLGLHEFDSDRKRMSVIVGCPDNTVKLFVKGADSSMLSVLNKSLNPKTVEKTQFHLDAYSSLGLRTLVIGMKELSEADYEEWKSAYEKASTALFGRMVQLRTVAANIERNLQVLGATGIEDKLQRGVPEAIESLRMAGMKVWVLTGDKQETAISIGKSCKLLTGEMTQIIINSNSMDSCKRRLQGAIATTSKISSTSPTKAPLALVIDGTSLVYILETELEEELYKVAIACDVVLCCRVAPLQKAGIVSLIKKRTSDMTLAIGDGANDVSMIQMADVGVGISGQEGRQAVMASDFAMGQFRFLVPLLLVHGHWNYQRMAYMILYNFYRNSVFVFLLFWYVFYTAFTQTTAITEWSSVLYSIIYTALPTIVVGIFDKDLRKSTLLSHPRLYGVGQREESYNFKLFWLTMFDSLWQSMAVFFIPYLAYRNSTVDKSSIGDIFTLGVVILVNVHLAMDVFRWNWITHLSIWGCTVATVIAVMIIDSIPQLPGYWAIFHIMGTGLFWLLLLMILVAGMVPRFFLKVVSQNFFPTDIQIAREFEKPENMNDAVRGEVEMSLFSSQNRRS